MNVFEFFGLPADFRKHPFQQVKTYDDITEKTRSELYPMYAQIKMDGVYVAFCFNEGKLECFGKSGLMMNNMDKMKCQLLFNLKEPLSTLRHIFISEVTNERMSLEELSGVINPSRNKPILKEVADKHYVSTMSFHDCLTMDEFIRGSTQVCYADRHSRVRQATTRNIIPSHKVNNEVEARNLFDFYVKQGAEGLVLKPNVDYKAGFKGWRMMKMVRRISLDLECQGYVMGDPGTKRFGQISKLLFNLYGKEIPVDLGKGWTDEDRDNLTCDAKAGDLVGEIFEVYSMKRSSKGRLRLPKVGERRHDKEEPDV